MNATHNVQVIVFAVSNLNNYRIRFLNADGEPIADRSVAAPSLPIAMQHAQEIATEINAADFFITLSHPDRR